MPTGAKDGRRGGFTLMEVLVALVVLGTGLVLLSQGLTAAIRASAQAERTTRASLAAEEVFRRMGTGEIDALSETEGSLDAHDAETALEDAEGVEAYRSDYRWISNVTPWTVENLYLVELRVSWTPTGFETDRFLEASRLFYIPPEDEESSEGSEGPAGSSGGGTG